MEKYFIKWIEPLVIYSILLLIFFPKMLSNPVAQDEYYWISTSSYFEEWVFLDSKAESWEPEWMTLSGPALPKYIIAVGRWLGGFHYDDVQRDELYTIIYDETKPVKIEPHDDLLFPSRAPMVILSALTGALVYALFLDKINRYAALFWLVLYASNNSMIEIQLVALSEAPLLFFTIISFFFILQGQKHLDAYMIEKEGVIRSTKFYTYYALAGVSIGLAAACKIHAFFFLITFGILLVFSIFIPKFPLSTTTKLSYLIRIFSLVSLSALFIFIILNPSIYANPIKGVGWMFQYRLMDMAHVSQYVPELITIPIVQRWLKILRDLLTTNASIRGGLGLYFNSAFSILGIYLLIRSVVTSIKNRMPLELMPSLMVFLSIMILAAFMSPLDWLRYFLFPIIGVMLLITYSTAFLFDKLKAFVNKREPGKVSAD